MQKILYQLVTDLGFKLKLINPKVEKKNTENKAVTVLSYETKTLCS